MYQKGDSIRVALPTRLSKKSPVAGRPDFFRKYETPRLAWFHEQRLRAGQTQLVLVTAISYTASRTL